MHLVYLAGGRSRKFGSLNRPKIADPHETREFVPIYDIDIAFLCWKLPPPPCGVLLVLIHIDHLPPWIITYHYNSLNYHQHYKPYCN